MEESILNSVKKILNLPSDYDAFDLDVIMAINTAIANLTQIGVGPAEGFEIEDDTAQWVSLLGDDPRLNGAKNYIGLYVRLIFDPPANSFGIAAVEKQLQEMLWRLEVIANPAPPPTFGLPVDPIIV